MKIYNLELNEQEFQAIVSLFNVAVKVNGLANDTDLIARTIINKIAAGEVKTEVPLEKVE